MKLSYAEACNIIQLVVVPAAMERLDMDDRMKKLYKMDEFSCELAGLDDTILISLMIAHKKNRVTNIRFVRAYPYKFEFLDEGQIKEWAVEIGQTLYRGIQHAEKIQAKENRKDKKA